MSFSSFGIWMIPEPSFLFFFFFSHKFCSLDDSVCVGFTNIWMKCVYFPLEICTINWESGCLFLEKYKMIIQGLDREFLGSETVQKKQLYFPKVTVGNSTLRWENNSIILDNYVYLFIFFWATVLKQRQLFIKKETFFLILILCSYE